VALLMAAAGVRDGVRRVLQRGQDLYQLTHILGDDARRALTRDDPFLRLAAWLSLRAEQGRWAPKLLVELSPGWEGVAPWLEQLVEESLGKGGKGFLVFYGQSREAAYGGECAVLRIAVEGRPEPPAAPRGLPALTLRVPSEPLADLPQEAAGLGELAGLFLGFKLTVAAYGYLQDIVFAGQPAVEAYKQYARDLREAPGPSIFHREVYGQAGVPTHAAGGGGLVLNYGSLVSLDMLRQGDLQERVRQMGGDLADAADVFAGILATAREWEWLRYLDLTWNGELSDDVRRVLERARDDLANGALGIPAKVRTGPSDYHSTEQGETDGPRELVSLRLVAERHEPVAAGQYDDKFLLAQARGTWQAMEDAGRWIVFMTLPEAGESAAGRAALDDLARFFRQAAARLR
jgi:hypothetical protein